ncbi:MAG: phytoene/squalene synthase family protein [Acidimicrobiales bacterium]
MRRDRDLAASYRRCRALHRACGTTYFWATATLPASVRPHVHALYGFCRHADDIVDGAGGVAGREAALAALGGGLLDDLERGSSDDPVLSAVVHTAGVLGIEPECFRRFLRSMAMDLRVATYESFEDLLGYMDGSAAVIGEMMLAVLRPADAAAALGPARDLGIAFQLTNFLRDVGEDADRGRTYLPQCDLRRFDASESLVARRVTPEWVALMRFEVARARGYYASAERGLAMLPPVSARCVATAQKLYAAILERIEANSYDVFSSRVRVPTVSKVAVAIRGEWAFARGKW